MSLTNFDSENLALDWISFNLEGLINPRVIADRFSKHFTPHVLIDDVPCIRYHGLNKKYKVSIRQYTGSKSYWVGTQIIFSGKDAAHCYNLIKTQKIGWETLMMGRHPLSLGRIDLYFYRTNDSNDTMQLSCIFEVI